MLYKRVKRVYYRYNVNSNRIGRYVKRSLISCRGNSRFLNCFTRPSGE